MAIGMLLIVAILSQPNSLQQLNRPLQDFAASLHKSQPKDDIVIIAIDDKSISELGRWPWRRTLHAELLDRVSVAKPKAIGLDVILSEPDTNHPNDDILLAAAIQRSAPVVLPVFMQSAGGTKQVIMPLDPIAAHAAGLGKIHMQIDSDGVIRRMILHEEAEGKLWDQFSLALLKAAPSNGTRPHAISGRPNTTPALIPYTGAAGNFQYISYIDVIAGIVPTETFKDKYVLIGATATGIGDSYVTPTAGISHLMPGVEILANITHALLHGTTLQLASPSQNTVLNLLFMLLALVGFTLLSPFFALLLTVVLMLALFACTYFAISLLGILFAPAAGILGLICIYPLWSWQRLNTAARFLTSELASLQQTSYLPSSSRTHSLTHDFLDHRIVALEDATQQLQSLHKFIVNSIDNLPYPTLITGTDGIIRIANQAAARHFNATSTEILCGRPLSEQVADVISNDHGTALLSQTAIEKTVSTIEGEARDSRGRELIVKCVPIMSIGDQHSGWILSLVDISKLRQAERDREEAFRFITHDIRAPLSSIITLLELHQLQGNAPDNLLQRLTHYADSALALADNFVSLSRAKSGKYQFELLDLHNILAEVADDAWAVSQARNIKIKVSDATTPADTMADRNLLARALSNLISNAIKFSPHHSEITCSISRRQQYWDIAIKDQGAGIPQEQQAKLFQPFSRIHAHTHPEIKGSGLGLAFVHAVAERHHGKVEVASQQNKGSTFHLLIPVTADAGQPG